MNISIALAAYNGEKYILRQLESILPQLDKNDEVVISDDGSSDKTLELVCMLGDLRVKVFQNPGKGVISNFENAIAKTAKEIIFLCDQDDVWSADKVQTMKKYFGETAVDLLLSDAYITDENLTVLEESFYKLMDSGPGFMKNFRKNSFLGCCMAFRSSLKPLILPFPGKIPMHDSWIGLLAELNGKVEFIPDKLVYYRRHGNNATVLSSPSLWQSLCWRKELLIELMKRQYNLAKRR